MEIHYIWIKDFGYLQKAEINLSARFIFKLTPTSESEEMYNLQITRNEDFTENFFEEDNIQNVTAIIGKNGSGKSSILNYLKTYLPDGSYDEIKNDIIVFSTIISDQEYYIVAYPMHMKLTLDSNISHFEARPYESFKEINNNYLDKNPQEDISYIYYSYFLEKNPILKYNSEGLVDLSTSRLLIEKSENQLISPNEETTKENLHVTASDLDYYVTSETARAVQLLASKNKIHIPFKSPEKLFIKIDLTDYFFLFNKNKDEDVTEFIENIRKLNTTSEPKERLINNLLLSLVCNFFVTDLNFNINIKFKYNLSIGKIKLVKSITEHFFKNLPTEYNFNGTPVSYTRNATLSKLIPKFIEHIEELIKKGTITVHTEEYFSFNIEEEINNDFEIFINLYLQIMGITSFLEFNWRTLSTGEQSFLSFIARFHNLLHHSNKKLKDNVMILIDEGDAGFHPEWQRSFFQNTITFLSKLFQDRKIQLIFTANTPFLTSDLPKHHLIFIEKKGKGKSIIHSKENNRKKTFGANIHSLLSDSFYMDGALIGEFAKRKIDKIILFLKNPGNREPDSKYKKVIEQIGEPIIRNKLLDMWNIKFGVDEEIEQLERRINELRLKKKSK
ncbi:AAA family ATPase [Telluribacter sp. SYSU D00476]|uniref:AAA family ATPase n=1 Tax=Telluribacter sp. SYSU D00476 TaxID=2811430 RepID=UPI001FF51B8C|nr:AAA family ATPase [Telluribacter sp. SYSU D00476]